MRLPARAIEGNVVWARTGTVWAAWRVPAVTYPYLPAAEKLKVHARIRGALLACRTEALLLSVCRPLAPREVAAAMRTSQRGAAAAAWRAEVRAGMDALAGHDLQERRHYLACRLPDDGGWRDTWGTASALVGEAFGANPGAVAARGVARARVAAAELQARLRAALPVEPLTPAELRWLTARTLGRGIVDLPPPGPGMPGATRHLDVLDAVVHEGGSRDDRDRPRHRRYLRVDSDAGTGYQTTLVIAEMPSEFTFPDGAGEWFFHADELDFPVDWSARVVLVDNQRARERTRRQQRQLAAQLGEYDGEPVGPPGGLASAMAGIDDQHAHLVANPADPELETTVAFTVWARDLPTLQSRAARVAALYEARGYATPRPTGGQLRLVEASVVGAALPTVCRDYTQHLLPRDLAAGAPFTGCAVGDPRGMLLGLSLDSGTARPVLLDPAYGPATNRSGSMGVVGALGSGKSYFVKRLAHATVARGGQVVVLDRTAAGEYARFAGAVPGSAQVVSLVPGAPLCLDPLRVFGEGERVRVAIGFLTLLTRTAPGDVQAALLADAVREAAGAGQGLRHVAEVLRPAAARDHDARVLHRKLASHGGNPLADLVFGDADPLSLDADYLCFHAAGLALPDRDQVAQHEGLLPEQLFGQALLYLVAAVAKGTTFADPRRFAVALFDEAWAITASPQGRQLLLDGIRDGRKHNAAVWLASQHPDDFGDDALADLLGIRVVFRQARAAAGAALAFAGAEPDATLVELVEALGEGQCLLRDVRDRVGLVQVLPAVSQALRDALDTRPVDAAHA